MRKNNTIKILLHINQEQERYFVYRKNGLANGQNKVNRRKKEKKKGIIAKTVKTYNGDKLRLIDFLPLFIASFFGRFGFSW